MKKKKIEISLESNIMEIIENYPEAIEVFVEYNLPCVGCSAARYESIKDIVAEFGIDGDELIGKIKEGIN
ncbi:MAG TPA: DUF1858 domain-containing protein [Candidatus Moranbacteria bacterium]|nr:DUF1858 domain-containing protein [Candidatus Moranbacteria bacterium]